MRLSDSLTPGMLKTTGVYIDALAEMGVRTVDEMILMIPRAYEDLSAMVTLTTAPMNEKVTIRGTIASLKLVRTRTRKQLVQAVFLDEEGARADIVWFNQPHMMRMLREGQAVSLTGKVQEDGYKLKMMSPQVEDGTRTELLHAGRIVAVYPQTEKLSSRWLREKMALLRPVFASIPESLPAEILTAEKLLARSEALTELHFPSTPEKLNQARERMAFEELFHIQTEALERKNAWQGHRQKRLVTPMDAPLIKAFFASLSFIPTDAQRVAIYEILRDMESDKPMSRLLEGDVGSGKTLVAASVIAHTIIAKGQCALMVPTEVLAKQHAVTITRMLTTFHTYLQSGAWKEKGIQAAHLLTFALPRVVLLTGSITGAESRAIKRDTAAGLVDVVIGTHALIEESVVFKDLKLAIIDEQHRFGVLQRKALEEKGPPHTLAMTATPIPRTLALTAYGDHDLSVLLTKPGNRKSIKTTVVPPSQRRTVELFIDTEMASGRQAFVICPLIEMSKSDEMQDVKNVQAEAERLQKEFPKRTVTLLHGRMTPQEKEDVMRDFKDRKADILVSTSVIEVGIDVPNSTIIVIEGAERFGLSQLHQFRGRVGRSDAQSYCFLFTTEQHQASSERLKAMEEHSSGFELAEIDLMIRGPGELFGIRQSGIPELRFGGLLNPALVVRARKAAETALGVLTMTVRSKRTTIAT
ncbi:MAG: ATP-dependent DNA helicase RecG [Candidatus Peribacteraceae bacterium]